MRTLRSLGFLLLAGILLAVPAPSQAQIAVGISVHVGPPVLPVYVQPVCPAPGYIWTPGYWAYGDDDYYWVPGTWVRAPEPGFLWTPGYWGFADGVYLWHAGYWGPHVGFYGGVNYGFGYTGVGFYGGEWRGREFVYNRSVTNINVTVVHNYYNRTVVVNENHVAFNGGPHGINARPNRDEMRFEHEHHIEARHEQMEHEHAARQDRSFRASVNHGRPAVAASARPGEFHRDVVAAREDRGGHSDAGHRNDRPEDRRNDRPSNASAANRNDHRNDRPSNASSSDRNNNRNDRPTNAVSHENASRPNSAPSNNARQAKEVRPVPNNSNSRGPQGEARGNPHVNNAPVQHSNGAHNGAVHSNNKPEQGKPEKKP
jgi:hypothetical protein